MFKAVGKSVHVSRDSILYSYLSVNLLLVTHNGKNVVAVAHKKQLSLYASVDTLNIVLILSGPGGGGWEGWGVGGCS